MFINAVNSVSSAHNHHISAPIPFPACSIHYMASCPIPGPSVQPSAPKEPGSTAYEGLKRLCFQSARHVQPTCPSGPFTHPGPGVNKPATFPSFGPTPLTVPPVSREKPLQRPPVSFYSTQMDPSRPTTSPTSHSNIPFPVDPISPITSAASNPPVASANSVSRHPFSTERNYNRWLGWRLNHLAEIFGFLYLVIPSLHSTKSGPF